MAGFREPPKEYQFTSENQPKNSGRKLGSKSFKTIFKKYLRQEFSKGDLKKLTGDEWEYLKDTEQITLQDAIVLRFLESALAKPDHNSIKTIMDRVDGLLTQKVDANTNIKMSPEQATQVAKEILKNDKEKD